MTLAVIGCPRDPALTSSMKINEAYNLWAATYDGMANRTRDLDNYVTEDWLEGKHFDTILEAGCGTGKNTPIYAAHADRVLAVDFSEGMLQLAQQKVAVPNVSFQQADFTRPWDFTDSLFDLVCCNLVLEHISNLEHIFLQVQSKLKPGGLFFLCELHPYKQYLGGQANFHHNNETVHVAAFTHHISEYFSAAKAAGLQCVELGEYFLDEGGREVPRLLKMVFIK